MAPGWMLGMLTSTTLMWPVQAAWTPDTCASLAATLLPSEAEALSRRQSAPRAAALAGATEARTSTDPADNATATLSGVAPKPASDAIAPLMAAPKSWNNTPSADSRAKSTFFTSIDKGTRGKYGGIASKMEFASDPFDDAAAAVSGPASDSRDHTTLTSVTLTVPLDTRAIPGARFTHASTVPPSDVEVLSFDRTKPSVTLLRGVTTACTKSTLSDSGESIKATRSAVVPKPASDAMASRMWASKSRRARRSADRR
mmetsp:Transcript_90692/g.256813  ORF Transcript_90692/g.256813 Transcript_90692/m.256813 type:complete len:257 (-) Transcript_90692:1053-1823(-)